MPERSEPWPTGTPAWVDASVVDLDRSTAFYAALLGWEFDRSGAEYGYYATARKNGRAVAGLTPRAEDQPGEPSWTTYLAVDDAADAANRAGGAGGGVVLPPLRVGEFGAMALLADPSGAVVGVWESGSNTGTELVNEPGSLVWNEAMVSEVEACKRFYTDLFGVSFTPIGEGVAYWTMDLQGRPAGGLGALELLGDGGLPPHWRTYFHSADVDADLARVADLGGHVVGDTHDSEFGRMGGAAGPDGEMFWLIKPPDWS